MLQNGGDPGETRIRTPLKMVVGIAQFELLIPASKSLKEKRHVLNKLRDRVAARYKLHISEVDYQDLWQRAGMGFSLVGNDFQKIESVITQVFNFIVAMGLGELHNEFKDIFYYEPSEAERL